MHDLKAMSEKTFGIAKEMFDDRVDEFGNFNFKPRPAKMSDLQVSAATIFFTAPPIHSLQSSLLQTERTMDAATPPCFCTRGETAHQ